MAKILLIDDDQEFSEALRGELELLQHQVKCFDSAEEGLRWLNSETKIDLILCDNRMFPMSGLQFLKALKDQGTRIPVILMTDDPSQHSVIEATKMGAFDYVCKPLDLNALTPEMDMAIREALKIVLRPSPVYLPPVDGEVGKDESSIVGRCPDMIKVFKKIAQASEHDGSIIILGETGTGKDLVAQAIHTHSHRKGPFVTINSAGLNENLYESELFGHEKGAFTGADKLRKGRFEHADGGTLFLDEVGDMPLPLQAKLLRVLDHKEITRMGGNQRIRVDVRVLAATNRDLKKLVSQDKFRDDLIFRLRRGVIYLPPLRDRGSDIEVLAKYFLSQFCNNRTLHSSTIKALTEYSWPGNVRDLQAVIGNSARASRSAQIMPEDLDFLTLDEYQTPELACTGKEGAIAGLHRAIIWAWENKSDVYYLLLEHLEREVLTHARAQEPKISENNLRRRFGISRGKLRGLLKKYNLNGSSGDNLIQIARQQKT